MAGKLGLRRPPCAKLTDRHGHLFHNLDAKAFQRHDLARMVGQQADGVQTQVGKNLRADAAFMLQLRLPAAPA